MSDFELLDWGDDYVFYRFEISKDIETAEGCEAVYLDDEIKFTVFHTDGEKGEYTFECPQTPLEGSYSSVKQNEVLALVRIEGCQNEIKTLPFVPLRYIADHRNAPIIDDKYEAFESRDDPSLKHKVRTGLGRRIAPLVDIFVRFRLGRKWLDIKKEDDMMVLYVDVGEKIEHATVSVMTRVRFYIIGEETDGWSPVAKVCYNPPFPITRKGAEIKHVTPSSFEIHVPVADSLADVEMGPMFPYPKQRGHRGWKN